MYESNVLGIVFHVYRPFAAARAPSLLSLHSNIANLPSERSLKLEARRNPDASSPAFFAQFPLGAWNPRFPFHLMF